MGTWDSKGCEVCRSQWMRGNHPPPIGVNQEKHSFLHRCENCGTYWEQFERYVDVIPEELAHTEYGGAFSDQ